MNEQLLQEKISIITSQIFDCSESLLVFASEDLAFFLPQLSSQFDSVVDLNITQSDVYRASKKHFLQFQKDINTHFCERGKYLIVPLGEDYIINNINLLGQGTFGSVTKSYKVILEDGEMVQVAEPRVIKKLNFPVDNEILDLAAREIYFMRECLVVPTEFGAISYGACVLSDKLYMDMVFLPGKNLKDYLDEAYDCAKNKLESFYTYSLNIKLRVLLSLLGAVEYIHEKNIVHGDLKPENVLIHPEEFTIRLADFGCSKYEFEQDVSQRGSPLYMAPEVSSQYDSSKKSDIYSLGTFIPALFLRKKIDALLQSKKDACEGRIGGGIADEAAQVRINFQKKKLLTPKIFRRPMRYFFRSMTHHSPEERPVISEAVSSGLILLSMSQMDMDDESHDPSKILLGWHRKIIKLLSHRDGYVREQAKCAREKLSVWQKTWKQAQRNEENMLQFTKDFYFHLDILRTFDHKNFSERCSIILDLSILLQKVEGEVSSIQIQCDKQGLFEKVLVGEVVDGEKPISKTRYLKDIAYLLLQAHSDNTLSPHMIDWKETIPLNCVLSKGEIVELSLNEEVVPMPYQDIIGDFLNVMSTKRSEKQLDLKQIELFFRFIIKMQDCNQSHVTIISQIVELDDADFSALDERVEQEKYFKENLFDFLRCYGLYDRMSEVLEGLGEDFDIVKQCCQVHLEKASAYFNLKIDIYNKTFATLGYLLEGSKKLKDRAYDALVVFDHLIMAIDAQFAFTGDVAGQFDEIKAQVFENINILEEAKQRDRSNRIFRSWRRKRSSDQLIHESLEKYRLSVDSPLVSISGSEGGDMSPFDTDDSSQSDEQYYFL